YSAAGFGVQSEGSGIIMSADGYIITNAHVVDGSEGIKVILDNDEAFSAKVIGLDVQSDIAVIKVDAENLTYADFGNSDQLEVGERVLAIGNPSGMELAGSVTQGIISAINRNLKTDGGYTMKFIQVDAAINPGNSGGALVNEYGQVVGINSSKIAATAYEGIGFAIPMNEAMEIVNDLIANGRVTGRAMLGFQGIQVDSVDTSRYGIPLGISIQKINEDSDLNNRNILPGDIITKLDNVDIIDFSDIRTVLANHKPGDFVEMVIFRKNNASAKGQYITVPVKLVEANVEKKAVN
ncbi:MAG: trypsin-like peptidase domain-containing protein, partial [Oscillospiraceae bacterium]